MPTLPLLRVLLAVAMQARLVDAEEELAVSEALRAGLAAELRRREITINGLSSQLADLRAATAGMKPSPAPCASSAGPSTTASGRSVPQELRYTRGRLAALEEAASEVWSIVPPEEALEEEITPGLCPFSPSSDIVAPPQTQGGRRSLSECGPRRSLSIQRESEACRVALIAELEFLRGEVRARAAAAEPQVQLVVHVGQGESVRTEPAPARREERAEPSCALEGEAAPLKEDEETGMASVPRSSASSCSMRRLVVELEGEEVAALPSLAAALDRLDELYGAVEAADAQRRAAESEVIAQLVNAWGPGASAQRLPQVASGAESEGSLREQGADAVLRDELETLRADALRRQVVVQVALPPRTLYPFACVAQKKNKLSRGGYHSRVACMLCPVCTNTRQWMPRPAFRCRRAQM